MINFYLKICLDIFFLTINFIFILYTVFGDGMKVKIFDENHEKDLEKTINDFLDDFEGNIIDIKYQVAISVFSEEQIYCFSAMIVYTN